MKEEKALEQLLEQMTELTNFVYENKSILPKKLPEDIEKQLSSLEKNVEFFQKSTQKALEEGGENQETLEAIIKSPPSHLSRKEKSIIKRSKTLKKEVVTLEKQYAKQAKLLKTQKKRHGKKGSLTSKERQRKFKRLGSKKGWKPI